MSTIKLVGRGLRGVSFADLARRTGSWGVGPHDSDATVLGKFAAYAGGNDPVEAGQGAYRYGGFAVDSIQPAEILMDHEVVEPHTLAANFAGCAVSAKVAPTAPWTLSVARNDATIGTMTIQPDGSVAMVCAAHPIAAGDIVTVTAPTVADYQIERVRFTFSGEAA